MHRKINKIIKLNCELSYVIISRVTKATPPGYHILFSQIHKPKRTYVYKFTGQIFKHDYQSFKRATFKKMNSSRPFPIYFSKHKVIYAMFKKDCVFHQATKETF